MHTNRLPMLWLAYSVIVALTLGGVFALSEEGERRGSLLKAALILWAVILAVTAIFH